jgi:hypothetical protein
MEHFNYKKHRWFFTKSGKLVYGGKNAEQNDEILRSLKEERILLHTYVPGSPFAVIDAPPAKVNASDLEEAAIWTACFSRAWRAGLRKTQVDTFTTQQIFKKKGMKTGTWGVAGNVERKIVQLKLSIVKQQDVLRCVPEQSARKSEILMRIAPGKTPKEEFAKMISGKCRVDKEEALQALPMGGFKVIKNN